VNVHITNGYTFDFDLISSTTDTSVIINNFIVKYKCCNITGVAISYYFSDKLEFSDYRSLAINGYINDRLIGQGNTFDIIVGQGFDSFLNVSFIVCERTLINHACISVKKITVLNSNSSLDVKLYYSRANINKIYTTLTMVPLSSGNVLVTGGGVFITVDVPQISLIEGDLVAIRTKAILGARYFLSTTLRYKNRLHQIKSKYKSRMFLM